MNKNNLSTPKEPWLAVSLSWLVPGCGQFYLRSYVRGIIFIMLIGLFHVFWLASLVSTECSIILTIAVVFCDLTVLPVFACVDAFKTAKRINTEKFETERASSKDPWLTVFLSLLLAGLGHAYIRKGGFLVLYIFIFLVLRILSMRILSLLAIYVIIAALFLFRVLVCIHAYAASPVHRERKKNAIIIFAVFLVLVQCLSGILIPWLDTKYLIQISSPSMGSSMSPTIKEGDKTITSKLAYIWGNPEIGDIVLITVPEYKDPWCKRVVAVGGETVQVKDGQIYVNGKKRSFKIPRDLSKDSYQSNQITDDTEIDDSYMEFGTDKPYLVPEGCYFVLGDNIQNSVDSRYYGAFSKDSIIGKVVRIYWPLRRIGTLY